jgi:hypothetical protein
VVLGVCHFQKTDCRDTGIEITADLLVAYFWLILGGLNTFWWPEKCAL